MKSTFKYISLLFFTLTFIVSCSEECCDYEDAATTGSSSGPVTGSPGSANLTAPLNNKNCEIGTLVDVFTSEVTFNWTSVTGADSYNLTYTDLSTNDTKTKTNITSTSTKIVLFRGRIYAWSVQGISSNSNRGPRSGTAKFYLQGNPNFNKVPLAAVLASPSNSGNDVTFSWTGKDPDANDTLTYSIYVDKVDGKQSPVSSGLTSPSTKITLETGSTYYWRIKSTDQNNNSSYSLVSKFSL
jgi:hypothetical protein